MLRLSDPDKLLTFGNSFELILTAALVIILASVLYRETHGFRDLYAKFKKMLKWNFQGGTYDFIVAMLVLVMGMMLRAESVWEWRALKLDFPAGKFTLALAFKCVAAFCLIRLLLPHKNYNMIAGAVLLFALLFALLNVR